MFASVLRKYISDLVLMIVLSIPSVLAVPPAVLFLGRSASEEEEVAVLVNKAKAATKNYNAVVDTTRR